MRLGVTDTIPEAPTPPPRAEREDDRTNDGRVLVLENTSASTSTTGTEETSIGGWKKYIRLKTTK